MSKESLNKNNPQILSFEIITILPPRTKEILKKRFGLEDGKPKTLEAVGQSYKITRERVRQIIESALKTIQKQPIGEIIGDFINLSKALLKESGGLEEEMEFCKKVNKRLNADEKLEGKGNLSAIKFLLTLSPDFILEEETESNYSFWHLMEISKETIDKNIKELEKYFKNKKKACLMDEILAWAKENISSNVNEQELEAYFRISKK